MPDKRRAPDMCAEELRVHIRDVKRRAVLIEEALERLTCAHSFEARHASGPRDNNEFEYVCKHCGLIY